MRGVRSEHMRTVCIAVLVAVVALNSLTRTFVVLVVLFFLLENEVEKYQVFGLVGNKEMNSNFPWLLGDSYRNQKKLRGVPLLAPHKDHPVDWSNLDLPTSLATGVDPLRTSNSFLKMLAKNPRTFGPIQDLVKSKEVAKLMKEDKQHG